MSIQSIATNESVTAGGRIKDATAARSLYERMYQADQIAARNRARVRNMIDGGSPKDEMAQNAAAGNQQSNINWGDGEQILHDECAPYFNLLFSNEVFGTTPMRPDYMNANTREEHSTLIAEEMTRMVRGWGNFIPYRMASILECKTHGLSFDYRVDDTDWRWETTGLDKFKLPRPCHIGVEKIPFCGVEIEMAPHELYAKIKNPDIATQAGWNVEAVKAFLLTAAPTNKTRSDWEYWENYWKDNDYLMGNDAKVCSCIAIISTEIDGTATLHIIPENPTSTRKGEDFLYKKKGRFKSMGSFVHVYMDNVGTNKHYQSIRGIASRIYPNVQELNRKTNNFSDMVDFECMPVFQPNSEVESDTEATSQSSAYLILNPGWTMPNKTVPNYSQSIIPALSMFGEKLRTRTSKIHNQQDQSGRMNKHQFAAQMEEQAQLSDADMELFMSTWKDQWRETVRRACRKGYLQGEPGGKEVWEMKIKLKQRGIKDPDAALAAVDWKECEVERGLGSGSAAAKIVILDRMAPVVAQLGPVEQGKYRRKLVMALGGVQMANELTPKDGMNRLPMDATTADATNALIMQGATMPVRDGQDHIVIAGVRLQKIQELNNEIAQGGNEALMQLAQPMHNLLADMQQHLEMASPRDPMVVQMTKAMGEFNEISLNGLKEAEAKQQKAQNEAAHNKGVVPGHNPQGDQPGQESQPQPQQPQSTEPTAGYHKAVEAAIRLKERAANLQYIQAKNQMALDHAERKFEQDKQISDLKTALDIKRTYQ